MNQDGNNRYTTEVVADNLTMLGKVSDNSSAGTNNYSSEKTPATTKPSGDEFSGPDENDDLPF